MFWRHKPALTSGWHHDVTLHLGCTNCTTKTRVCKICPRACERHYQALLSTPAPDPCIAAAAFSIWTFSWERRGGGGLSHTLTLWHHNITPAFMHDVPETGLVRAESLGFAKVQQGGQMKQGGWQDGRQYRCVKPFSTAHKTYSSWEVVLLNIFVCQNKFQLFSMNIWTLNIVNNIL